jgi:hypothetical protein
MMHLTEAGGTLDAETEGVQFQLQITGTRTIVAKFRGLSLACLAHVFMSK